MKPKDFLFQRFPLDGRVMVADEELTTPYHVYDGVMLCMKYEIRQMLKQEGGGVRARQRHRAEHRWPVALAQPGPQGVDHGGRHAGRAGSGGEDRDTDVEVAGQGGQHLGEVGAAGLAATESQRPRSHSRYALRVGSDTDSSTFL